MTDQAEAVMLNGGRRQQVRAPGPQGREDIGSSLPFRLGNLRQWRRPAATRRAVVKRA